MDNKEQESTPLGKARTSKSTVTNKLQYTGDKEAHGLQVSGCRISQCKNKADYLYTSRLINLLSHTQRYDAIGQKKMV